MYLTHDVQTALHVADQHQADARAAFPRGRRVRTRWASLARTATPTSPNLTPSSHPRRGTPAPA